MASWFLAPSLEKLRDEVNAAYPGRSKKIDGTIGDAAHSARVSQHNPNRDSGDDVPNGAVTAIDITATNNALREKVLDAVIGSDRAWYVISRGHIWSRTYGWAKRNYNGSNPHNDHIHISLRQTKSAVNSTKSWGIGSASAPKEPGKGGKYVVESGDTLSAIADKFGVTVDELVELNDIDNPNVISVGQVLILDADDEPEPPKPAPKPEPKPSTKKLPTLSRGDRHELVSVLKRFLGKLPNDDKVFGPRLQKRVREYQKNHRLQVDGVVGPQTWGSILKALKLPGWKL